VRGLSALARYVPWSMVVSRLVLSGMIATGSGAIILMEATASLRGNAKFSRLLPLNSPCADRAILGPRVRTLRHSCCARHSGRMHHAGRMNWTCVLLQNGFEASGGEMAAALETGTS